ncbi:MAG: hypothetical protein GY842_24910 [bacterium]|nr:hypothetical protein [bacterium]
MARTRRAPSIRDVAHAGDRLAQHVEDGRTDAEIQGALETEFGHRWHLDTIRRYRRGLGVSRAPRKDVADAESAASVMALVPPLGLDRLEKAEWYRTQFRKSHLRVTLQDQFEPDEVDVYLQEYGDLCCQFSDIVASEFLQIDDFLKHRLLIARQLSLMKTLRAEIESTSRWLRQYPPTADEPEEEKKRRIGNERLIDSRRSALKQANDRYDKLSAERNRISQSLAATRKDRLEELRGGGESFLDLVCRIQQSDRARQEEGRFAELSRMALEDEEGAMRREILFPDGGKDPLILDDRSAGET